MELCNRIQKWISGFSKVKEETLDDTIHESPPLVNMREIAIEIGTQTAPEVTVTSGQTEDDNEVVEIMTSSDEKTVSEKLQEVIELLEEISE